MYFLFNDLENAVPIGYERHPIVTTLVVFPKAAAGVNWLTKRPLNNLRLTRPQYVYRTGLD